MGVFRWDESKNKKLQKERNISFEEILDAMTHGGLLDDVQHPHQEKYRHQRLYVIQCRGYVWLVPYEEKDGVVFLRTIIPSRKYRKKYERRSDEG